MDPDLFLPADFFGRLLSLSPIEADFQARRLHCPWPLSCSELALWYDAAAAISRASSGGPDRGGSRHTDFPARSASRITGLCG